MLKVLVMISTEVLTELASLGQTSFGGVSNGCEQLLGFQQSWHPSNCTPCVYSTCGVPKVTRRPVSEQSVSVILLEPFSRQAESEALTTV